MPCVKHQFTYGLTALLILAQSAFVASPNPVAAQHTPTANNGGVIASSVVMRDKPFSDEDFAQHLEELKLRLPHDAFHIIVQKPFVIIGDEAPNVVEYRAERTVKWAVDRIKQIYFEKDPTHIIDIWLFKDKESYEKHTYELFGKKPHTPYGYYSSRDRALVMNIATGGGTLVHEIVHPFIEANFDRCPAWFNEGLASLYEQCQDRDGKIWGLTNWRLRGLQLAIEADRLPTFEELFSTTTRQFYNDDPGTNYSQARYLCYYLQEKGLLVRFYHEFVKTVDQDATGYLTLQRVLERTDMDQFETEWKSFILDLRFER
ncbi:MAG TPA: hypothetical protein PKD64_16490 [Pirellulaceae bacterium]|nr:hypothetical protein [Pirellulaceae bacterium]HMO93789.1 hypothetical protein [Pirellulaceae bacterium]HMP70617.1 hypothetical protein [Pirellulaceae bacterium]